MKRRKGLCCLLLTAMTGVMLTCGSFSVYAEPDDTVSGGETSALQESFAEVSASVPTENSVTEASDRSAALRTGHTIRTLRTGHPV